MIKAKIGQKFVYAGDEQEVAKIQNELAVVCCTCNNKEIVWNKAGLEVVLNNQEYYN